MYKNGRSKLEDRSWKMEVERMEGWKDGRITHGA
jgi:hypothetical protein